MDFNFVDVNSKQSEADGGDDDDEQDHFNEDDAMAVDPLSTDTGNPSTSNNAEIKGEYDELILKCEPIDYDNEDDLNDNEDELNDNEDDLEDARDESLSNDGAAILPENDESQSSIQSSVGNCLETATENNLEVERSPNPKTSVVLGNQLCHVIPENSGSTAFRIVPNIFHKADPSRPSAVSTVMQTPKNPESNNESAMVQVNPSVGLPGSSRLIKIQENMYLLVRPIDASQNNGPQSQGVASNQLIGQPQTAGITLNQSPNRNVLGQPKTPVESSNPTNRIIGLLQTQGVSSNQTRPILGKPQTLGATTSQSSSLVGHFQTSGVTSNQASTMLGLPQTSGLTSNEASTMLGLPQTSGVTSNQASTILGLSQTSGVTSNASLNSSILNLLLTKGAHSPITTSTSSSVTNNQIEKQKSLPIEASNQLPKIDLTHEQPQQTITSSACNVTKTPNSVSSVGENLNQSANSNKFELFSINGSQILLTNPTSQSAIGNVLLGHHSSKQPQSPGTCLTNQFAINPVIANQQTANISNVPLSNQSLSKSIMLTSDQIQPSVAVDSNNSSNRSTNVHTGMKYGLLTINGTHLLVKHPSTTAVSPQVGSQSPNVVASNVASLVTDSTINTGFLLAKTTSPVSGQSNNGSNVPSQSFLILKRSQPQQSSLPAKKDESILSKQQIPATVSSKKSEPTKDCTLVKPTDEDSAYILPTVGVPLCNDQSNEGNLSSNHQSQPIISSIRYGSGALDSLDIEDQKLLLASTTLLDYKKKPDNGVKLSNKHDRIKNRKNKTNTKNQSSVVSKSGDSDRKIIEKSSEGSDSEIIRIETSPVDLESENGGMDEDLLVLGPEDEIDPLADTEPDPLMFEPEVIFDDDDNDDDDDGERRKKVVRPTKSRKEVVDESTAVSCPICKQRINDLETHIREKHQFVCGICDKVFNRKPNLITHLAVHSDKREFACKLCDKTYKSKAGLFVHQRSHDIRKRPACDYCSKTFLLTSHLQEHISKHHAGVAKRYVCDTCGEEFLLKRIWMLHKNRHKEEGILCMVCGRRFASDEDLKQHSSVHTKQDLVHDFCCDLCGRTFRELHFLTAHREAHARRKFKCKRCKEVFGSQHDIEKHRLAKHQFICRKCSKEFTDADTLNEHRRTHYKRQIECGVCNAVFQSNEAVKVHMNRVHLQMNEKVFECDTCKKAFSSKNALVTHKITHTADTWRSAKYKSLLSKDDNSSQIEPEPSGVS